MRSNPFDHLAAATMAECENEAEEACRVLFMSVARQKAEAMQAILDRRVKDE